MSTNQNNNIVNIEENDQGKQYSNEASGNANDSVTCDNLNNISTLDTSYYFEEILNGVSIKDTLFLIGTSCPARIHKLIQLVSSFCSETTLLINPKTNVMTTFFSDGKYTSTFLQFPSNTFDLVWHIHEELKNCAPKEVASAIWYHPLCNIPVCMSMQKHLQSDYTSYHDTFINQSMSQSTIRIPLRVQNLENAINVKYRRVYIYATIQHQKAFFVDAVTDQGIHMRHTIPITNTAHIYISVQPQAFSTAFVFNLEILRSHFSALTQITHSEIFIEVGREDRKSTRHHPSQNQYVKFICRSASNMSEVKLTYVSCQKTKSGDYILEDDERYQQACQQQFSCDDYLTNDVNTENKNFMTSNVEIYAGPFPLGLLSTFFKKRTSKRQLVAMYLRKSAVCFELCPIETADTKQFCDMYETYIANINKTSPHANHQSTGVYGNLDMASASSSSIGTTTTVSNHNNTSGMEDLNQARGVKRNHHMPQTSAEELELQQHPSSYKRNKKEKYTATIGTSLSSLSSSAHVLDPFVQFAKIATSKPSKETLMAWQAIWQKRQEYNTWVPEYGKHNLFSDCLYYKEHEYKGLTKEQVIEKAVDKSRMRDYIYRDMGDFDRVNRMVLLHCIYAVIQTSEPYQLKNVDNEFLKPPSLEATLASSSSAYVSTKVENSYETESEHHKRTSYNDNTQSQRQDDDHASSQNCNDVIREQIEQKSHVDDVIQIKDPIQKSEEEYIENIYKEHCDNLEVATRFYKHYDLNAFLQDDSSSHGESDDENDRNTWI